MSSALVWDPALAKYRFGSDRPMKPIPGPTEEQENDALNVTKKIIDGLSKQHPLLA